jgi:hypothetical protein
MVKGGLTKEYGLVYYKNMPELSRFLGISILMYFDDHNPPHFHVRYNDHRALISIVDLRLFEGHLPARVLGLVIEWAELHKEELLKDWDMVKATGQYFKIDPLV